MLSKHIGKKRKTIRARALAAALVAIGFVALPLPASAEQGEEPESDQTAAERAEDEGLEVLFITAEKTERDVQETGGSVVAFTETMLEDRRILDVKDLSDYVPNLKVHTNPGGNTGFAVNIRGAIKGDPIVSREPAVGLYIDDVYHATMVGILFDTLDLEAVEVLRGPQGTLYGRNTNGGAIKFRTKAPADLLSVQHDGTFGNYTAWSSRSIVNIPLLGGSGDAMVDTSLLGDLNTRTAFAFLNRDGFVDLATAATGSVTRGPRQLDDLDRKAIHHRTRWLPTEDIVIDYFLDWVDGNEKPTATQLSSAFGPSAGLAGFVQNGRADNVARNLGADGRFLESKLDVLGHSVVAAYELDALPVLGDLTIKSITAKRSKQNRDATDVDGTPIQVLQGAQSIDHDQFTQELQFTGFADGGWADYVAGFYYFHEKAQQTGAQRIFGGANTIDNFHEIEKRSYAGYAQVNVMPHDKVMLTGGLRYTYEDVTLRSLYVANGFPLVDTGVGGTKNANAPSDNFDKVSWLARLQVEPTEDLMAYFKVNTGFLSGGFNARNSNNANLPTPPFDPTIQPFGTPYKPEHLLSYELGFRSDLFDQRVRLNLTWFYYDYENIQVSVLSQTGLGAFTLVQNAADANIWGFELDFLARPFSGAEFMLSYGYTNPEYEKYFENGVDVKPLRQFAQTADHTLVLGGSYELPPFSWGTVMGRLDWSWSSGVGFNAFPSPAVDQDDPFWTLNAMLQVADVALPGDTGSARLQLWMNNITDESYKEFGFTLSTLGIAVNTYNDPRTYGFTLVYEWEQ